MEVGWGLHRVAAADPGFSRFRGVYTCCPGPSDTFLKRVPSRSLSGLRRGYVRISRGLRGDVLHRSWGIINIIVEQCLLKHRSINKFLFIHSCENDSNSGSKTRCGWSHGRRQLSCREGVPGAPFRCFFIRGVYVFNERSTWLMASIFGPSSGCWSSSRASSCGSIRCWW